ncbi:carbohydrate-binding module family 13 protein [Peniophora sp. CONT]|nr:carbohydrate-binding module family 13 protein [Peniophora sp. CONT]
MSWIFEQHDGGWLLRNKSQYDKTLHVQGDHLQAGNGVEAIANAPNPTLWDVDPADDNTVILKVHGHGYVLDLTDHGNSTPGTAIGVYGNWGGENQRWRLTEGIVSGSLSMITADV